MDCERLCYIDTVPTRGDIVVPQQLVKFFVYWEPKVRLEVVDPARADLIHVPGSATTEAEWDRDGLSCHPEHNMSSHLACQTREFDPEFMTLHRSYLDVASFFLLRGYWLLPGCFERADSLLSLPHDQTFGVWARPAHNGEDCQQMEAEASAVLPSSSSEWPRVSLL